MNSLFCDPNIFGRFLALVVIVGAALYLAARLRDRAPSGGAPCGSCAVAVALAAVALVATVSRSSVTGLLLGALVLEMAWLGRRKGGVVALVTVLVLARRRGRLHRAAPAASSCPSRLLSASRA